MVETLAKPENKTLLNERFIALHMIWVKIIPDAPTSEPATISTLLSTAKPAAQAARPEYEFSNEITTGMSAPPIGITTMMPKRSDRPTTV